MSCEAWKLGPVCFSLLTPTLFLLFSPFCSEVTLLPKSESCIPHLLVSLIPLRMLCLALPFAGYFH